MRVSLDVATNAMHSPKMRQQLYFYLLLTRAASYGNAVSLSDFRAHLADCGKTPSMIKRGIQVLQQPYGKDGTHTALIYQDRTEIRPVAIKKVAQELGFVHLGWIHLEDADMESLRTFRIALFDHVSKSGNRDVRGNTSPSRLGMQKHTGVCPTTQRKYERIRDVEVQRNVAIIVNAPARFSYDENDELVQEPDRTYLASHYWGQLRPDIHPCAVTKANTYTSRVAATSQLAQDYRIGGTPAKSQRILQPEYGVRSLRNTFESETFRNMSYNTLCSLLEAGVNVDVFAGYTVDPKTGEKIGVYHRYMADTPVDEESQRRPLSQYQRMNHGVLMA